MGSISELTWFATSSSGTPRGMRSRPSTSTSRKKVPTSTRASSASARSSRERRPLDIPVASGALHAGFRLARGALALLDVDESEQRPADQEERDEGQDGAAAGTGGADHQREHQGAQDARELLEHGEEREELR